MIAPNEVHLGEHYRTGQAGRKVLDVGNRIAVGHRNVIEPAVIPTWTPPTARLRDDVERGSPGAVRSPDNSKTLQGVKLRPSNGELSRVEAPGPGVDRRASGRDVMLHSVLGGGS